LNYRADIDGLRAIAVLSVVFYHLGFEGFSGGFVGVDVFFVISGYLITNLIWQQSLKSSFSFSTFYLRRIRRLFPAILTTLLATLIGATLLMNEADFKRFGAELLFATTSVSNFYFWGEADYFDVAAGAKPLLHTWSLAVEEQFYLIWPALILFVAIRTPSRKALITLIGALFFLSIFIAELLTGKNLLFISHHLPSIFQPDNPQQTLFYLFPFRIFEFCFGAILVVFSNHRTNKSIEELTLLIGLFLIAYSILFFDKGAEFPWPSALIPCLGTALCIYSGRAERVGTLLSNRPTVYIGLISYSLYLVHWPIIVFFQYYVFRPLSLMEQTILLTASILIAAASHRYVEMPFRNSNQKNNTSFLLIVYLLTIGLTITSASIFTGGAWSSRTAAKNPTNEKWRVEKSNPKVDAISKRLASIGSRKESVVFTAPNSQKNRKRILIIGDSHAGRLKGLSAFIANSYGFDVYLDWRPALFQI